MLTGLLTQILALLTSEQENLGIATLCSNAQPSETWKAKDYPLVAVEQLGGHYDLNRSLPSAMSLDDNINIDSKSNSVTIFVFAKAGHDWDAARTSASAIAEGILNLISQNVNLSSGDQTMSMRYTAGTDKINDVKAYVYRLDIEVKEKF